MWGHRNQPQIASTDQFLSVVGQLRCWGFHFTFPGGPDLILAEIVGFGAWRPSLTQNQGVWVSKINLKLRRVIGERSGRAHSKAETLGSRFHVPQRLANTWLRFEVESKWLGHYFSKGQPSWVAKSTSNLVEESEEDDCGGK